jgi:hypothetical protein
MPKKYFRLHEVSKEVAELYNKGITRGSYLGFECMHELFSFKMASTTYIYGSPFSGKSEFWFEIMMNLSEFYGYRHAIYSPESGSKAEIFAELVSKRVQKPFYRSSFGYMTEQEMYNASAFVNDHFFIIDPEDSDLTIEGFFEAVDRLETEFDVKIHTTCCDPFNELKHDFSKDEGRQDLYIENRLGVIRKNASKNNRHNCIITHARDQGHPVEKDGVRYYPPATPREIAGGQAWYRKAMNLICIWRPPEGMIDSSTGAPFENNEVHVMVQKFKPKGVGKKGTAKLYYDGKRNRYYEYLEGKARYADSKRPILAGEQAQYEL